MTETSARTGGFVTVYPSSGVRSTASNLNYSAGVTQANSVTVTLGSDGVVDFYNSGRRNVTPAGLSPSAA